MYGNMWEKYDQWLTTDILGERAWREEYEREWAESLVREEFPHIDDEEYISSIAAKRLETGYYDDYDF